MLVHHELFKKVILLILFLLSLKKSILTDTYSDVICGTNHFALLLSLSFDSLSFSVSFSLSLSLLFSEYLFLWSLFFLNSFFYSPFFSAFLPFQHLLLSCFFHFFNYHFSSFTTITSL